MIHLASPLLAAVIVAAVAIAAYGQTLETLAAVQSAALSEME